MGPDSTSRSDHLLELIHLRRCARFRCVTESKEDSILNLRS